MRKSGLLGKNFFPFPIFTQHILNPFAWVQNIADRTVMIQRLDNQGNVLAHVAADIVRTFQKFRALVFQVCGQNAVNQAFLVSFVKLFHAVCKQSEGSRGENPLCFPGL